ncbi:MAG: PilZ domain-containing protein [Gammaproteobacteria bacterium]|nr:PilZ domain-containing protein [Gammaproteobacteria bacterium]
MHGESIPRIKHRLHERCGARFDVELKLHANRTLSCTARDVSVDGIFVELDAERAGLHSGCGVQVVFSAYQDGALHHYLVTGVITHCNDDGAGIMFAACERPLAQLLAALANADARQREYARVALNGGRFPKPRASRL